MLQEALKLRKLGFHVFPVFWVRPNGLCGCGRDHAEDKKSIGKHPVVDWQRWQIEMPSEDQVKEWWHKWPNASIGAAMGGGIEAVDDDDPKLECPRFATLASRTGSGGWHLFFRSDRDWPNRPLGDPFPVGSCHKGRGGYVILPPSTHASGNRYCWANDLPMLDLPVSVKVLLNGHSPAQTAVKVQHSPGERNDAAMREVCRLFGKGLAPREVLRQILDWNQEWNFPALPEEELVACVKSIWNNKERPKREDKQEEAPGEGLLIRSSLYMMEQYGNVETRWLVPGWLPTRTLLLIGAPPESYKSWVGLSFCLSVSTGRPFMGKYRVTEPGNVLIAQQEDDFTLALGRMAQLLRTGESGKVFPYPGSERLPYWTEDRSLHVDNPQTMTQLREACGDLKLAFVLIDPLYSFLPLGDDYGAQGAAKLNAKLKGIRDEFGTSFALVHHTSRAGTKDEGRGSRKRDSLWGSVFINAGLETAWHLRTLKEGGTTVEVQRHSKMSGHETDLLFDWRIDDWTATEVLADQKAKGVDPWTT